MYDYAPRVSLREHLNNETQPLPAQRSLVKCRWPKNKHDLALVRKQIRIDEIAEIFVVSAKEVSFDRSCLRKPS